ncbi:hypothetical protein E2C01_050254 [Portunus trituberculatus]|uniref:Uncharacterized protein n=1 Tax=Portunus trituberculatus TaxID=210409 RepID=A0A5B7G8H7_PORTR|nr:hypothetical protein [Portunus trituberculatus]
MEPHEARYGRQIIAWEVFMREIGHDSHKYPVMDDPRSGGSGRGSAGLAGAGWVAARLKLTLRLRLKLRLAMQYHVAD